jgi:hypothetical protein
MVTDKVSVTNQRNQAFDIVISKEGAKRGRRFLLPLLMSIGFF